MMYSIFFNDRKLVLQSQSTPLSNADLVLNLDGTESREVIQSIVQAFDDNPRTSCLSLRSASLDKTWKTFKSLFESIEAAGGVVINPEGRILMIYRNGKWDLPKGKRDNGESIESCAIREVEEECGIDKLSITKPLSVVYHTYKQKGKIYLKETFWYLMESTFNGKLVPQEDEGITDVRWMSRKELIPAIENTWTSIRFLLNEEVIETEKYLR